MEGIAVSRVEPVARVEGQEMNLRSLREFRWLVHQEPTILNTAFERHTERIPRVRGHAEARGLLPTRVELYGPLRDPEIFAKGSRPSRLRPSRPPGLAPRGTVLPSPPRAPMAAMKRCGKDRVKVPLALAELRPRALDFHSRAPLALGPG